MKKQNKKQMRNTFLLGIFYLTWGANIAQVTDANHYLYKSKVTVDDFTHKPTNGFDYDFLIKDNSIARMERLFEGKPWAGGYETRFFDLKNQVRIFEYKKTKQYWMETIDSLYIINCSSKKVETNIKYKNYICDKYNVHMTVYMHGLEPKEGSKTAVRGGTGGASVYTNVEKEMDYVFYVTKDVSFNEQFSRFFSAFLSQGVNIYYGSAVLDLPGLIVKAELTLSNKDKKHVTIVEIDKVSNEKIDDTLFEMPWKKEGMKPEINGERFTGKKYTDYISRLKLLYQKVTGNPDLKIKYDAIDPTYY
jgi:hypothetical protein